MSDTPYEKILRQKALKLQEKSRTTMALALAVEDGELTTEEAVVGLSMSSNLNFVQSDIYPGDSYFDCAVAELERDGQ